MQSKMKIKKIFLLSLTVFLPFITSAQDNNPGISPSAVYINDEGKETKCWEDFAGQAPLEVTFSANPRNMDAFSPVFEWHFQREGEEREMMVRYEEPNSGCTFALGFAWGRLVRAKEIYNGFARTTSARSGTFKKSDWSVIADINIRLYKNLCLDFRYEYSMVPIRTMNFTYVLTDNSMISETYKLHNHMISTRLVYYINEKFYRNTRVNKYGQPIGTRWMREIPDYND